ncbi:MAG: DUF4296 domain-containing protein [Bacteroidales bacterium]|nr:DUF4296 domain-containing protein [Bacteroidales bacterium]
MKPKAVSNLLLLIVMGILISSCQNRPKEVLNRKRMEQLMYDVYIAEATIEHDYESFNSSEKKEAYINKVFAENNVTQAQWDSSLSWYSDKIDLYLKMNDSVKARLKRAQSDIDKKISQLQSQSFTPDTEIYSASYIPLTYSFNMPGSRSKGFRFQLDSTEISSNIPNNYFSFNLNAIGVPTSETNNLKYALILVYNDTTIYKVENIDENRNYGIPVSKYVNNDTLIQIFGFVHLETLPGITPNIQLYDIYLGSQ